MKKKTNLQWLSDGKGKKNKIARNKHGRNLIPLVSAWRRKKKEEEEWPWSWRNAVDEWRKGEPAFLGGKNAGVWFGGKNDLETLDWICFVLTSFLFINLSWDMDCGFCWRRLRWALLSLSLIPTDIWKSTVSVVSRVALFSYSYFSILLLLR